MPPEKTEVTTPVVTPVTTPVLTPSGDDATFKAAVAAAVAEQLKDVKAKMDSAYSQRDEVLATSEALKQQIAEQATEKLKAEGKQVEALELQLAQEAARSVTLASRNIELTRDLEIKSILNSFSFRTDRASKMAFSEITGLLKQNENGSWEGKNGDNVEKVINDFVKNEENEFLLKPKVNSGGDTPTTPTKTNQLPDKKKSLFQMTQAEVLAMAAEGKFSK